PRSPAASPPDLFAWPLTRPLERDVLVARRRRLRWPELDQVFDLEPIASQHANPVPVREMELDPRVAGPLDAPHPERWTEEPFAGDSVLRRHAEREEHGVHEEDQLAAGSQDPRRLGHPAIGIRPEAGAVFRDRQIERRVPAGHA